MQCQSSRYVMISLLATMILIYHHVEAEADHASTPGVVSDKPSSGDSSSQEVVSDEAEKAPGIVKIPTITLKSGFEMPMLGLGTARLEGHALGSISSALKLGYRLIDTAKIYTASQTQTAEQAIGKVVSESGIPREEIFLVTKILPADFRLDLCRRAIEESLKYLQTSYIDLVLLHAPGCFNDDTCKASGTYIDAWKSLEVLVDEGMIRSLGVSNCVKKEIVEISEIAKHPVSVVQNWFDPLYQDKMMRMDCQDMGIVFMGYSALGIGWIDDGYEENPVLTDPLLQNIAKKHERQVSEVVLKWAIASDVVVMPGSTKTERLAMNLNSLTVKLTHEDIQQIDQLDGSITPEWGEEDDMAEEEPQGYIGTLKSIISNLIGAGDQDTTGLVDEL